MIRQGLNGFLMALADSVPGVSGGTVAFLASRSKANALSMIPTAFAALLFLSFSGMLSTNLRRACDQQPACRYSPEP